MLTRKHIEALYRLPNIELDEQFMPYKTFDWHCDEASLEEPFLEKLKLRFGHQMEVAFMQAIERANKYKVLAHNIQIIEDKQTLGEIDYILQNNANEELIHLEIAVKFYLFHPDRGNELEGMIGPNHKDKLVNKIKKLNETQFPILFRKTTKKLLSNLGIDTSFMKQELCFKCMVFVPPILKEHELKWINNDCIAGTYIPKASFVEEKFAHLQFHVPTKLDWILSPDQNSDWYSFAKAEKIVFEMLEKNNAPMVWIKNHERAIRLFVIN